ncbi:hypothetical protein PS15m_003087 [Mucor circinelloides]
MEKPVITALLDVCNQTGEQYQKLKEVVATMPDSLLKKPALAYAEDGCQYTDTCKKKYMKRDLICTSPTPAPLDLPELDTKKRHRLCSSIQKQSSKPMNWKECYEEGKKDGCFSKPPPTEDD